MWCGAEANSPAAARDLHLSHLRVNAACEALSSTRNKVSEIAFSCGYGNLSNFNRQFKRTMGCSPNEYRKQTARTNLPPRCAPEIQKA